MLIGSSSDSKIFRTIDDHVANNELNNTTNEYKYEENTQSTRKRTSHKRKVKTKINYTEKDNIDEYNSHSIVTKKSKHKHTNTDNTPEHKLTLMQMAKTNVPSEYHIYGPKNASDGYYDYLWAKFHGPVRVACLNTFRSIFPHESICQRAFTLNRDPANIYVVWGLINTQAEKYLPRYRIYRKLSDLRLPELQEELNLRKENGDLSSSLELKSKGEYVSILSPFKDFLGSNTH